MWFYSSTCGYGFGICVYNVCIYTRVRRIEVVLSVLFYDRVSLTLELTYLSRLTGWQVSQVLLSPTSECSVYRHAPLCWMLGLQVYALCQMLGLQACIPVPNAGLRVCALCSVPNAGITDMYPCDKCWDYGHVPCAKCWDYRRVPYAECSEYRCVPLAWF